MSCDIDKSVRLNQITVKFNSTIGEDTRKALREAGFSWSQNFLAWTAPFTPERNRTINLLCNGLDAEITSDNMTKAEIAAEIAEYKSLLNQPDNIVPADEKELAKEEIASLEAQLAEMDEAPKPAATEPKAQGRPKGSQNKGTRKSPPALTGEPVDKNGDPLKKGDTVKIEWDGNFYEGTVTAPMRYEGGSHSVKFMHQGKTRTMMRAPKYVEKVTVAMETVSYTTHLRADQVQEAIVAKHRDCDEAKTNLVVPTEAIHIALPTVADPAKGDMVEVHEDGTPKAVITKQGLEDNFTVVGEGDMKERPDGTVKFSAPSKVKVPKAQKETAPKAEEVLDKQPAPDQAAKPKPEDDTRKYRQIKSEKPTGSCSTTREAAKTPALVAFLEGMVHDWHAENTVKRIKRVLWRKSDNKLLIEVRDTLFAYSDYFTLCPETGKTKETDAPAKSSYSTIMGEEAMKDMYRNPHSNSCRRVAAALYGECYRNGGCSEERQKRLYAIFASKCIKRNLEVAKQRVKWLHEKTKQQWQGYKGEKSYAQLFRETARANYKK